MKKFLRKQLKGGMIYFSLWFGRVQSIVCGFTDSGKKIMVWKCVTEEAVHLRRDRKQRVRKIIPGDQV
jgi:hypothetical protein